MSGNYIMYLQIFNKLKPHQTMVIDELTDFLFEEGWRILNVKDFINGEEYLQMDKDKRQASIRQYGF